MRKSQRCCDNVESFKNAYTLEFLGLPADHSEADLHGALLENLGRFSTELGRDFCFAVAEYPVQVGSQDFSIDLLFFHRELSCLVAFELKVRELRPEDLGKLSFYLEALDRDVRKPHERPNDDGGVETAARFYAGKYLAACLFPGHEFRSVLASVLGWWVSRMRGVRERWGKSRGVEPTPDVEELARIDAHLFWLARGRGRVRLRIGGALAKLGTSFRELGFANLAAYARERASRSGAWAMETRRLAVRLGALPLLRAAVEEGRIGWSMAELCARHASVDDEADVLALARGRSVLAMRKLLRERAAEVGDAKGARDAEGDEERTATLSLTLPVEDAWALATLRWLVRHMEGSAGSCMGRDGWLDAVLGEGQSTLLEMGRGKDRELLPASVLEAQALWRACMEEGIAQAARDEEAAEKRLPLGAVEAGEARDAEPLPSSPVKIDRVIRDYCAELAARDLYFGRVLAPFMAVRGWKHLGYATETQYARERLGMSRASMRAKMALARKAESLAVVEQAVHGGRLGYAHAGLVTRVATKATAAAWVERAERRTYKHLREEIEAVEMFARLLGREMTPPSDDEMAVIEHVEREVLSGEYVREVVARMGGVPVQTSDTDTDTGSGSDAHTVADSGSGAVAGTDHSLLAVPVQTSVRSPRALATVMLRLRVNEDVALHYRQLEAAHADADSPGGSFVSFLCLSFFMTWWSSLGESDRREMTYRIGLYRCASPVCDCRDVTCHHIRYIGRGGPDELWNTVAACVFCHLFGEHGGRLTVRGKSPDQLVWTIGREPILRVEGRELAWAA